MNKKYIYAIESIIDSVSDALINHDLTDDLRLKHSHLKSCNCEFCELSKTRKILIEARKQMKLIEYKDLENGDEYWIIEDGKPCWTVFDENSTYSKHCFESEKECIDFIKKLGAN